VTRKRRAAPLAPSERRAAIVEATIPLLYERGWTVTTREIAQAAGVAEGTIFSVFEDKEAVLVAALDAVLDPAPLAARLSQIDPSLPLEDRLVMAAVILQENMAQTAQFLGTLRSEDVTRRMTRAFSLDQLMLDVLAPIFESSRAELRVDPAAAAQALVALTMFGANPRLFTTPLPARDIVTMMLDGIRAPADRLAE
jgi:AcrR family transcriptional regulator